MPRKIVNKETQDTQALTVATNSALSDYKKSLSPVSVSGILMSLGGDKSELARQLAGVGPGKLPDKGTLERTRYNTQMKNISRWLSYESGKRDKNKARSANNKATQDKLKDVEIKAHPPKGMNISITGWIGDPSEGTFRLRTITIDTAEFSIDIQAFLTNMSIENATQAYKEVFAHYAPNLMVAEAENIDISLSQE